jgi:ABC-type uncharacterized transport system permease subunit
MNMRTASPQGHAQPRAAQKAASRRIALVLLSIAVVFFGGVILAQYSGAPSVGIGVLGFAILGFLLVAIGRNVRK